jgi:integrase
MAKVVSEAPKKRKLPAGITERISKTTGEKSYQVRIRRVGNGEPAFRTFEKLKEAEAWLAESIVKINSKQKVATSKDRSFTINDAIDDYIKADKVANAKELQMLGKLREEMANFHVVNFKVSTLEAWKNAMLKTDVPQNAKKVITHKLYEGDKIRKFSESTVRKYFFTLKKVLEWHSIFKNYPFNSPFDHVSAPAEDNSRSRRVEEGEEARLIAACDKMYVNQEALKAIINVALETAMRAGEILKMEWHEVDFSIPRIEIPKHKCKTKRYREVPLTSVCLKVLQDYKKTHTKDGETRVFWQWADSNVLGHRFKVVVKNAAMQDFKFHDFRHEAISRFYERTTLRDTEIASISGHSDTRTLMRYQNLRSNKLALKLW